MPTYSPGALFGFVCCSHRGVHGQSTVTPGFGTTTHCTERSRSMIEHAGVDGN